MTEDPSVRQWLEKYGDWLAISQLVALMVSSVIGFMQRSKGIAIMVSHVAASVSSLALFMLGVSYNYGVILVSMSSAILGGGLGMALFRLLISVSDRVDKNRDEIAGRIVGAVPIPGDKND